jgi:hypothetical protein
MQQQMTQMHSIVTQLMPQLASNNPTTTSTTPDTTIAETSFPGSSSASSNSNANHTNTNTDDDDSQRSTPQTKPGHDRNRDDPHMDSPPTPRRVNTEDAESMPDALSHHPPSTTGCTPPSEATRPKTPTASISALSTLPLKPRGSAKKVPKPPQYSTTTIAQRTSNGGRL